ncbi:MAG: hypothetical protein PHQ98_03070 [Candidatus ainarchaeum sp.]|nr:hypothetical protein [Candidatus ainarchaeum sp.]
MHNLYTPKKAIRNPAYQYEEKRKIKTHNKIHVEQTKKNIASVERLTKLSNPLMELLTKYFESGEKINEKTQKLILVRLKVIANATKRQLDLEKIFIKENKISVRSKSSSLRIHGIRRNLNNLLIYTNYLESYNQLPEGFTKQFKYAYL